MKTLFYKLPRLTILAMLVIIISGFFSVLTLGRQEDPTLTERYGYILTTLPGADAERMEARVTEPLERLLLELPEIQEIKSSSRAGVSQVSITVREDLSPERVDNAWTLIRQQIGVAEAELPDGASKPFIKRVFPGAHTMVVALSWMSDEAPPLAVMSRLSRSLEDRFRNLGATEETEIFGLPSEEVRIIVDTDALAASGLSPRDAARRVAAADVKVPAGDVRARGGDVGIEIGGEFDSISRIRAVPLVQLEDGRALRVGDVAEVRKGIEDPVQQLALTNGRRSIFVAAYIQPNQRVDRWSASARAMVEAFALGVSEDISVDIIFDQNKYTESRLNGLAGNLLFSALIVFVALFFVMGWRSALIVGSALPLTIALVLTLFQFFSIPLHQMSVTGLVISLGLLIDNAIVIVDEYDQERNSGLTIVEAIERAVTKLFGPLVASTLTTALAFAPIALLPGGAGEFVGVIGTSVIFSIVSSLFIALTIIPAIAGLLDLPSRDGLPSRFWRDGVKFAWITDGYRWSVERVLRFPVYGLIIGIVPAMIGFTLAQSLPSQFFPPTERDQFQLDMSLSPQATIDQAIDVSQRATELLLAYPAVASVNFVIGEPGPKVYYNAFNNNRGISGAASGFVQLEQGVASRDVVTEIQAMLRREFPAATFLASPFEQGPPSDAPIAFYLRGDSLPELSRLGNEARRILSSTPGITFTTAQLSLGAPTLTIEANETAAALAGVRLTDVALDVRSELEGVPAGSVLEGVEEVPVRLIAGATRRSDMTDFRSMRIGQARTEFGAPISAIGDIILTPQSAQITRLDGRRVNEIYGFIEPYALPDPILAAFLSALEDENFELPANYDFLISGQASESDAAMNDLLALAVPLILIMTGAVALVFNSFRMAFLILGVGGLAMGLAFGGVWLFNLPLGFNAIIGALGLLGIAINGSIVVLSLLQANPACLADDIIAQRETVVSATRHIVATTLTTMGGFVPIILTGDVFWMPLASAIAGGVAGSALLALYFTPAVFRIMTMKPVTSLLRRLNGEASMA